MDSTDFIGPSFYDSLLRTINGCVKVSAGGTPGQVVAPGVRAPLPRAWGAARPKEPGL